MGKSQDLYTKAKRIIPGGTQLLSKRPEMFLPDLWPAYYKEAKGCEIIDLDGKKYIDMITMGIGACILGYSDDDVNGAVKEAIDRGSMTSLNAPEEVELAELLCELHPWAEMVRYTRSGGEAMTVAIRIARAKSKKDKVMFCGYHGWHDWYLSTNLAEDSALDGHLLPGLEPSGVPRALTDTAIPFLYNDPKEFLTAANAYKKSLGAVVLEIVRNVEPTKEFLETVRSFTRENNIVFIVDEITAGWRLNVGGAHLKYDLKPDIAVFAKGMSNGYPMAAIIGTRDVMESAQETFISSTYWTERIGPTAALATIKKMARLKVADHLIKVGKMIQEGWKSIAEKHGLKISLSGIYPLSHFNFEYENSLKLKTLYTQIMLDKGYLASNVFYSSLAHTENHIKKYLENVESTFKEIASHISNNTVDISLKGPVSHSGFKRLN